MKPRNTFWGILFILLGAIVGSLITQSDFYARVIYLLLLFIFSSYIWAILAPRYMLITRKARGLRQQFGSVFEEQYEVKNVAPFTKVWLEVEDEAKLPGLRTTRVMSQIKKRSIRNFSTYTLLSMRGEFVLSPTKIISGDPFGLFISEIRISSENRLLVLPYLIDLAEFPFPVGLLPGGTSIRRKTPELQPPRVSTVREYAPSDSLNRIHWPTTARKDRLMVKEFEQDPLADVWIFLDAQSSVHIHSENEANPTLRGPLWWLQQIHNEVVTLPEDTFEYATCIAGSIVRFLSQKGQVVGFASDGQARLIFSAEKGERQLSKILETLALLKCEGKFPFPAFVNSLSNQIPKGSTVILITPTSDGRLLDTLAQLLQRGMNPLVVLIDAFSFKNLSLPSTLTKGLFRWKIPFTVIRKGDDIKERLEKGFEKLNTYYF